MKKNQEKIKDLEADIKSYDRLLRRHADDHNTHYVKAGALFDLGKLTGEDKYYQQALLSYNEAIRLNPESGMYLADRSKLYALMGKVEAATQDIISAQRSPESDRLLDLYTKHTIKDVMKLDGVRGEVAKLIAQGKIPFELQGVFSEMIDIISGISTRVNDIDVKVTNHEETLEVHTKEISEVKIKLSKLAEYEEKYPAMVELVGTMQKKLAEVEGVVKSHNITIESLSIYMTKLVTKDEFAALSKKFDKVEAEHKLFGGKLEIIEGTIEGHAEAIIKINETLKVANCFNKQEIKKGFDELKVEDIALYNYANNFYWSLSNYLLAYRAISTGAVQGLRDKSKFEKIWENVGSFLVNATGSIPGVGSMFEIIESSLSFINNTYKEMKFERKVEKINQMITQHILEEDLNLAVASAAIQIAKLKKAEILTLNSTSLSGIQYIKSKVTKQIGKFETIIDKGLTKICKVSGVEKTPEAELAIKDVILFINHIAMNEITLVTSSTVKFLDGEIANVFNSSFNNNTTEEAIRTLITDNMQGNGSKGKCIIAIVNDIVYDNPMLNHPELLKDAAKFFGFSNAVSLSSSLSNTLIDEAIANHDSELILAGMLSVQSNHN